MSVKVPSLTSSLHLGNPDSFHVLALDSRGGFLHSLSFRLLVKPSTERFSGESRFRPGYLLLIGTMNLAGSPCSLQVALSSRGISYPLQHSDYQSFCLCFELVISFDYVREVRDSLSYPTSVNHPLDKFR